MLLFYGLYNCRSEHHASHSGSCRCAEARLSCWSHRPMELMRSPILSLRTEHKLALGRLFRTVLSKHPQNNMSHWKKRELHSRVLVVPVGDNAIISLLQLKTSTLWLLTCCCWVLPLSFLFFFWCYEFCFIMRSCALELRDKRRSHGHARTLGLISKLTRLTFLHLYFILITFAIRATPKKKTLYILYFL